MLVLMRREGSSVFIGDDIVVTIVRVESNGEIRLGIEAPREVAVVRDDAIRRTPAGRGRVAMPYKGPEARGRSGGEGGAA